MHGTLKTIKVEWLGSGMLEMYPPMHRCYDTGVVVASFTRTAPVAREGP